MMNSSSLLPLPRFHSAIARLTAAALMNCGRAPTTVATLIVGPPPTPPPSAEQLGPVVPDRAQPYDAPSDRGQTDRERFRTPDHPKPGGADRRRANFRSPPCKPAECFRIRRSIRHHILQSLSLGAG